MKDIPRCRNELWNPLTVLFVLHAGARSDVSVAQPWFHLSVEQFDRLHDAGMSIFESGVLLLILVP